MKESSGETTSMSALALSPIFETAYTGLDIVKTESDDADPEASGVVGVDSSEEKVVNALPTILDGELFRVVAQNGDKISAQCCQCPPYKKPIRGTRLSTGNFLSHLVRVHPDTRTRVQEKRREKKGLKRQFSDTDVSREHSIKSQLYSLAKSVKASYHTTLQRRSISLTPITQSHVASNPQMEVEMKSRLASNTTGNGVNHHQNAISIVPLQTLKSNTKIPEVAAESAEDISSSFHQRKICSEEAIVKALEERAKMEVAMTAAIEKRARGEAAMAEAMQKRANAELAMAVVLQRRARVEEVMVSALEKKIDSL